MLFRVRSPSSTDLESELGLPFVSSNSVTNSRSWFRFPSIDAHTSMKSAICSWPCSSHLFYLSSNPTNLFYLSTLSSTPPSIVHEFIDCPIGL